MTFHSNLLQSRYIRSSLYEVVSWIRMYYLFLAVLGVWLTIEGLCAILYVYPPPFWAIVRIVRVLIGVVLLLEARRIRLKYRVDTAQKGEGWKLKQTYIDFLSLVGVWMAVDGIGTGFLGYVYPVVTWQIVRVARIIFGIALVVAGRHFVTRLGLT